MSLTAGKLKEHENILMKKIIKDLKAVKNQPKQSISTFKLIRTQYDIAPQPVGVRTKMSSTIHGQHSLSKNETLSDKLS